jgi:hypothetical protein
MSNKHYRHFQQVSMSRHLDYQCQFTFFHQGAKSIWHQFIIIYSQTTFAVSSTHSIQRCCFFLRFGCRLWQSPSQTDYRFAEFLCLNVAGANGKLTSHSRSSIIHCRTLDHMCQVHVVRFMEPPLMSRPRSSIHRLSQDTPSHSCWIHISK